MPIPPPLRLAPLALATSLLLPAPTHAGAAADAPSGHTHEAERLDQIVVSATPLKQSAEELARPVSVLAGDELDAQRRGTLGDTVAGLPGVRSAGFGPGVGRPVIRGLDGARVQTLSGGLSSLDASTVSADHAVSIEPFLAEQIEVLKGPATLLYGSGAIGGAVNVVDGRIPEMPGSEEDSALSGRAELRGDSAADQRTAMFKVQGGNDRFQLTADGLHRETDDVRIPGFAESAALLAEEGEEPDPALRGILPNSATRTRAGGIGGSWFGERGFLGLAFSGLDTLYGIPGHGHAHEEAKQEEEDDAVRIDLEQRRLEARGALLAPFAHHDSIGFKLAHSRYQHLELEGDAVGTRFENDGIEGRIEAVHGPLAGWRGAWGLQFGRRDFSAVGEEAFVPSSVSRDLGLFVLEQKPLAERWRLELGGRVERVAIDPEGAARVDFDAFSASAALRWQLNETFHLDFGLDRAERAPTAEELFSDGPHVATRSFELGDPGLETEVAHRLEVGSHWHIDGFSLHTALYTTRFDRFIFLADTGLEQDGLPLRIWQQGDARFHGFEIEFNKTLGEWDSGRWELGLSADAVRARLEQGGDLPRIPAARIGGQLRWELGGWRARIGVMRHADQDRVASFERPSRGYTLVDAGLSYHFDVDTTGWEVFLEGSNLSDQEARPHTSLLKDLAPLPGRNLQFGVRAFF